MEPSALLAVTHEVSFRLKGDCGLYFVEHRTVGVPGDDPLCELAAAARRTYDRLHGVRPERLHVFVTPLCDEERDRERERIEEDLRALRYPAHSLDYDDYDDAADLERLCQNQVTEED